MTEKPSLSPGILLPAITLLEPDLSQPAAPPRGRDFNAPYRIIDYDILFSCIEFIHFNTNLEIILQ